VSRAGETFTIDIKGEVAYTPGVDWGRPLVVVFRSHKAYRTGLKLVLRRQGHSSWAGRFSLRDYVGTLYMVVVLHKEKVSARSSVLGRAFTRTVATVIEAAEPGPAWRPTVARFIALAKK
jgi:hypothetical protein